MRWPRVRRWQVRVVTDVDDRGRRLCLAWSEAQAWRRAHRRWGREAFLREHFACGSYLAQGCIVDDCDVSGWLEVRRSNDSRSLAQVLMEEAARGR